MPNKINEVLPKRSEKETPTVVDLHGERHPTAEEKMQRFANREVHRAVKTEQNFDKDHDEFTDIGPH